MSEEAPTEAELRIQFEFLREEVAGIARRLDAMAMPLGIDPPSSLTPALTETSGHRAARELRLLRRPRAPLPDPRLVERIVRQRRLRERYFEKELFADPAWDILLDLTAARAAHRRVSVTSLCVAAAVPATTALRWVKMMTDMGVLVRVEDPDDKRRVFVALSDDAADAMARYFDELGGNAGKLT